MGDQPDLLQHILAELTTIRESVSALHVEIATLKTRGEATDGMATDFKALNTRVALLEVQAAQWTGAAGVSSSVAKWGFGILAGLLLAGIVAAVGLALRH